MTKGLTAEKMTSNSPPIFGAINNSLTKIALNPLLARLLRQEKSLSISSWARGADLSKKLLLDGVGGNLPLRDAKALVFAL